MAGNYRAIDLDTGRRKWGLTCVGRCGERFISPLTSSWGWRTLVSGWRLRIPPASMRNTSIEGTHYITSRSFSSGACLYISSIIHPSPFVSTMDPNKTPKVTASSRMKNLEVSEATPAAIPSLTTVVPRAFHKNNAFHRAAVPDTPLVREWYARVFADEIQDPSCHVLTVIDNDSQNDSSEEQPLALGILLLRLMDPSDKTSSGIWTKHAITPDHDREKYEAMVVPMGAIRAEIMGRNAHFLLELFGVDDEAKGMGLGRKLLQRACEISDEVGVDIFVEGNMFAVEFYRKFGFEVVKEIVLPGEEMYGEAMLVRSAVGGGRGE